MNNECLFICNPSIDSQIIELCCETNIKDIFVVILHEDNITPRFLSHNISTQQKNTLSKKNIRILFNTDSFETFNQKFNNILSYDIVYKTFGSNVKLFKWPTSLLTTLYTSVMAVEQTTSIDGFEFVYSCLNFHSSMHRVYLLDKLWEANLWNYGLNTGVDFDKNVHGDKEWYGELDNFDKEIIYNQSAHNARISDRYLYTKSFLEIVTESTINRQRFSEKTWKPILRQRPFLIVGAPNINHILHDKFGFMLYDEIIDYSFDRLQLYEDRVSGIIENINKIKDYNLSDIYKMIEPKIKYNFDLLNKIFMDDKFVDDKFLSELHQFDYIHQNFIWSPSFFTEQLIQKYFGLTKMVG